MSVKVKREMCIL